MTSVQEYSNAVLARSWREESATQLFEEELRNYRTNAHGDGEEPIRLRDWMRAMSRDSQANQREAWEAQRESEDRMERRNVPTHVVGADSLTVAREIADPEARLAFLTGLIEETEAVAKAARFLRKDTILGMRADGMTFAQIGEVMGMTREAVFQIAKKEG